MKRDPLPTLPFHHAGVTVTRAKPRWAPSVSTPSGYKIIGYFLYAASGEAAGYWTI